MSPRAAWWLEALGFNEVYDYVAGKADWLAFALPRDGTAGPTVGEVARQDAPTASLGERLSVVQERVQASGWDTCVVISEERVVFGRLGRTALRASSEKLIEELMAEGPSTIRPSMRVEAELKRMIERNLTAVVVTTPDGRLFGVLRREDVERLA